MRRRFLKGLLATGAAGLAMGCGNTGKALIAPEQPPAVRVEEQPARPAPGFAWQPGRWDWNPEAKRYMWVPGRWRRILHPHHRRWVAGEWVESAGGYKWTGGYWR